MSEPIMSVSGLRGILGTSLSAETISKYVATYSGVCPPGPVVVGRDGRATGIALVDLIAGTLALAGREVLIAGVAATPTVGRLVRQHAAAGAVQITASHNPPEYNGLKLFGPDGRVLPSRQGQTMIDRYRNGAPAYARHDQVGRARVLSESTADHLQAVLALVDVARIRRRRFRTLLDSNAGAGSVMGLPLLQALGCDVVALGAEPTGIFLHPPEPTAEHLSETCRRAQAEHVAVGFCQDPDADRLALIDANGIYLGEEYTLAICAAHVLKQRPGPLVTNCSTSRMTEDLAQQLGTAFSRSKVGEAHVADRMIEVGAVFGGEGNGGPIDPRVGYIRDSFVGMALVLDAMAVQDASLRELAEELPKYGMFKTKVALSPAAFAAACEALQAHFPEAHPDPMDGLRLDWPDRWLLIRSSNTEPIVRIFAEAPQDAAARDLAEKAIDIIRLAVPSE